MKINKPWILLIPVAIAACAPPQPDNSSTTDFPSAITAKDSVTPPPEKQLVTVQKAPVEQPVQQADIAEVEIVNNVFASDPFEEPLFDILKSIDHFEIVKGLQGNVPKGNVADTLVQVMFDDSKIIYVQGQDTTTAFIMAARINSGDVLFKEGITVGMSADEFASRFTQLMGKEDFRIVTIVNDSHTFVVQCMFERNRLSEINFDGSVD